MLRYAARQKITNKTRTYKKKSTSRKYFILHTVVSSLGCIGIFLSKNKQLIFKSDI